LKDHIGGLGNFACRVAPTQDGGDMVLRVLGGAIDPIDADGRPNEGSAMLAAQWQGPTNRLVVAVSSPH